MGLESGLAHQYYSSSTMLPASGTRLLLLVLLVGEYDGGGHVIVVDGDDGDVDDVDIHIPVFIVALDGVNRRTLGHGETVRWRASPPPTADTQRTKPGEYADSLYNLYSFLA